MKDHADSYGGLPSLLFLEEPLFQRGETGLPGGGRLVEPEEEVEKSIGASGEINLRDRNSLSPSGRLENEWVLPCKVNFTAKGKDQRFLMSRCKRTVRRGFSVLWMVAGAKSANT